jgi:hypothetical protein
MTTRRIKAQKDDLPRPWEDRPISRERWERHRESMLARSHEGRRPEEWWAYDSPVPRDRDVAESIQLYEMGELDAAEMAELMPTWREHFQRGNEPGFAYCRGAGNWLKGKAARRALYQWAGIPEPILEQFKAEAGGDGEQGR